MRRQRSVSRAVEQLRSCGVADVEQHTRPEGCGRLRVGSRKKSKLRTFSGFGDELAAEALGMVGEQEEDGDARGSQAQYDVFTQPGRQDRLRRDQAGFYCRNLEGDGECMDGADIVDEAGSGTWRKIECAAGSGGLGHRVEICSTSRADIYWTDSERKTWLQRMMGVGGGDLQEARITLVD